MGGSGGGGPMGNIFKVGKSNAKMVKKEDMKVTFKVGVCCACSSCPPAAESMSHHVYYV